jgi:guanosine-3',5'-bis(diphosphate) 3'-pyrophosphohydrolase
MQDSLQRIKAQPKEVRAVKLADRITNLQPPPKHWTVNKMQAYQKEALLILEKLKDTNDYLENRLKEKCREHPMYFSIEG